MIHASAFHMSVSTASISFSVKIPLEARPQATKSSRQQRRDSLPGIAFLFTGEGQGGEGLAMEEEKEEDADAYGGIGKVEDGAEKDEAMAAPEGKPIGQAGLYEGEIEHVHDFAMQPLTVTPVGRKELGYLPDAAVEDHAIENRIDDVTHGAGQNHGETGYQSERGVPADQLIEEPSDGKHGNDAEEGEEQLVHHLHPEGHAGVFREIDLKPGGDGDALMQGHVRLHPTLGELVDEKYKGDDP